MKKKRTVKPEDNGLHFIYREINGTDCVSQELTNIGISPGGQSTAFNKGADQRRIDQGT